MTIKRIRQFADTVKKLSIVWLLVFQGSAYAAEPATNKVGGNPGYRLTVVNPNDQPVPGAMVSWWPDEYRRITRFTNLSGQLVLEGIIDSAIELKVRYPGMIQRTVIPESRSQRVSLDADPDFLRSLPSSEWLSLLPEGERKQEFILNCASCHEISYDRVMINGRPRSQEEWRTAITMMRAIDIYDVIPPDFDDENYATWLAENLSVERIAALKPPHVASAEDLSRIEITEYRLPREDSLPHDLVTGPDGRIWITAFHHDELWALTPESGDIQRFSVDDNSDVNAQPRALKFGRDGMLWLVNGGSEAVLRFDPATGDYVSIDVDMYAHSIDIDPSGDIWVNDYFASAERVARVARGSHEVSIYPLPPAGRPVSEGLPLPYGLQIDADNRLYSTQMAANTLARFNTESGESTLFEMPAENSGPRRPGLDNENRLWIPEFNTGHVSYFDPELELFDRVRLGASSIGLYDIEVNKNNNDVWATGSLASTLIRYQPDEDVILTIPLPTEPAYTRHIAIDEISGDIWTAYSSLPAARPKVVRVRFLSP